MTDQPEGEDIFPYKSREKDNDADATSGAGQDVGAGGALECPICLQPCMHPVELPCRHVFCFLCIKGVAMQGPNSKCAICRATIPYSVLTNPQLKDVSQLYKEPKLANGYQWYYESRSGGWWQYDERTMQDLEREFSSNQPTCQLLLAGHLYVVDFNQMIQYRLNNRSVSRRIRRGINLEKRGVAGIRISGSNTGASSSGGTNNGSPPPAQSSGPTTRRRTRGNSSATGTQSQTTAASGHVHAASGPGDGDSVSSTDPQNTSSQTSSVNSPPHHNDQRVSDTDSDDESEEDEDYDSDYSDVDEDMELGEEEEALIGDDSDERETEDEEEYEARDGARAPTRRSDRSNSSNNQTPPPPSGNITHGASNNRTYSPNPSGRNNRGARNGRNSGGGRSGNNGATSRNASLSLPEASSGNATLQSSPSPNSNNLTSPLLFHRCNLDDVVSRSNSVNSNVFVDPQLIGQVNYTVSQSFSSISSSTNTAAVKFTFDMRSQLNQEEYL